MKTVILEEVAGVKTCVRGLKSCREPRRDRKLLFERTNPGGMIKFAAAFAVLNLQRGLPCSKGLAATREGATMSRDSPSELVRAIHSVRKEINRLSLEQVQALQEAISIGMTPDEAKECNARVDKIVELIDVLEQLESNRPPLN